MMCFISHSSVVPRMNCVCTNRIDYNFISGHIFSSHSHHSSERGKNKMGRDKRTSNGMGKYGEWNEIIFWAIKLGGSMEPHNHLFVLIGHKAQTLHAALCVCVRAPVCCSKLPRFISLMCLEWHWLHSTWTQWPCEMQALLELLTIHDKGILLNLFAAQRITLHISLLSTMHLEAQLLENAINWTLAKKK